MAPEVKLNACFDFVLVEIGSVKRLFYAPPMTVKIADIVKCETQNGIKEGVVIAKYQSDELNNDLNKLILEMAEIKSLSDIKRVIQIVHLEEIEYQYIGECRYMYGRGGKK